MTARLEAIAVGTDGAAWDVWQTSPGGSWSGWTSLGGWIQGSPSIELNGNVALEMFGLGGNAAYHNWQTSPGGSWNGWSPLGGIIVAPPSVEMNFDGRMEIFGLGEDGNVYHNWQLSAGGGWSGWAPLTTASNTGTTNGADISTYFVSDAQDEAYYAIWCRSSARQTCRTCGADP